MVLAFGMCGGLGWREFVTYVEKVLVFGNEVFERWISDLEPSFKS